MSGCYGNSPEDRYFENLVTDYLDTYQDFTGKIEDMVITDEFADGEIEFVIDANFINEELKNYTINSITIYSESVEIDVKPHQFSWYDSLLTDDMIIEEFSYP